MYDDRRLLRKLDTTERVILGLLSQEDVPLFVAKKLNKLEELIREIPSNESNLSDEWNARLVELWARHVNRDTYSTITGVSSATSAVGAKKPETDRIPEKQKQYRLSKERFGSMSSCTESDSPEVSVTTQANDGERFMASTPVGSIVSEQHLQYFDEISDISRQTGAYSHNVQLITPPPSSFDNGPRSLLTNSETVHGSTPSAIDRLVHNLAKYEAELRGLLKDGNSSVIEEKLTQFSFVVKQIPAEHSELKKQWNDKLAAMKAKAQGTSTSNSVSNGKTVPTSLTVPMGLFIEGLIEDLRQHESTFQALIASRATKSRLDDELNKLLELNEKIPKHEAMKEFADEWKQKISIYLGMYLDAFTVVHKRPITRTDEADAPYDNLVRQMFEVDTKIEMLLDRDRLEAIQGLIDQMKTLYEQIPEHRVKLRHYWTLQHKWRLDDLANAKIAQAVQAMGEEEFDYEEACAHPSIKPLPSKARRAAAKCSHFEYLTNMSAKRKELVHFKGLRGEVEELLKKSPVDWTAVDKKIVEVMTYLADFGPSLVAPLKVECDEKVEKLWEQYNEVKEKEGSSTPSRSSSHGNVHNEQLDRTVCNNRRPPSDSSKSGFDGEFDPSNMTAFEPEKDVSFESQPDCRSTSRPSSKLPFRPSSPSPSRSFTQGSVHNEQLDGTVCNMRRPPVRGPKSKRAIKLLIQEEFRDFPEMVNSNDIHGIKVLNSKVKQVDLLLGGTFWRDEELQTLAKNCILPKMSVDLRNKFLNRTAVRTVRNLRYFLETIIIRFYSDRCENEEQFKAALDGIISLVRYCSYCRRAGHTRMTCYELQQKPGDIDDPAGLYRQPIEDYSPGPSQQTVRVEDFLVA